MIRECASVLRHVCIGCLVYNYERIFGLEHLVGLVRILDV